MSTHVKIPLPPMCSRCRERESDGDDGLCAVCRIMMQHPIFSRELLREQKYPTALGICEVCGATVFSDEKYGGIGPWIDRKSEDAVAISRAEVWMLCEACREKRLEWDP